MEANPYTPGFRGLGFTLNPEPVGMVWSSSLLDVFGL